MNNINSVIKVINSGMDLQKIILLLGGVVIFYLVCNAVIKMYTQNDFTRVLSNLLVILFMCFGLFAITPKFTHKDYVLKYSYNLSLGGYVEFDVIIKDKNHKLDKKNITNIYKELRNIVKTVNFSNSRVELENGIKEEIFRILNEKYDLGKDNTNNIVDVLITVI